MTLVADKEGIPALSRIATEFERSRFSFLELTWAGGSLRLSKSADEGVVPRDDVREVVCAPKIGIYRASGIPLGSRVNPDSILGFIDVLGAKHPVRPRGSGRLADCSVANGAFVEYGAVLFRLTGRVDRSSAKNESEN